MVNCILLALNDPLADDAPWQATVDNVLLGLYTAEAVLKILGMGFFLNRKAYLRDYWNILDFIIVVTAYIPLLFNSGSVNLKALRSLRVLRPLRTISSVKSLRNVVITILKAIPLLVNALFILFFVLLIFSIAGLQLFAGLLKKRCFDPSTGKIYQTETGADILCGARDCPLGYACGKMTYNPDSNLTNFDTIANAFIIVFQVVTLEGWSIVMYEVMDSFTPIALIYFILLVFVAAYFLLNILLAVIKATFSQNAHSEGTIKDLTYDEKLAKLIEAGKANILNTMRRYKLHRGMISEYYELKTNGTLVESSRKHASDYHRSKSSSSSYSGSIFRRVSTAFGKLRRKGQQFKVAPSVLTTLQTMNPQHIQEDHLEPYQLPTTESVEKNATLEQERQLTNFPTLSADREELRDQAEPNGGNQILVIPDMDYAQPTQTLNIPSTGTANQIKEDGIEHAGHSSSKTSEKQREPRSRKNTLTKKAAAFGGIPTIPIRPIITASTTLFKPAGGDQLRQSLIGIAGINKTKPQNREMRPLEFEDLFAETQPEKLPPTKLFEKGSSQLENKNKHHRHKHRRRSLTHAKDTHSIPSNEESFQISSIASSMNEIPKKPSRARNRQSTKKFRVDAQLEPRFRSSRRRETLRMSLNQLEARLHSRQAIRTDQELVDRFDGKRLNNEIEEVIDIRQAELFDNRDEDKFYLDIRTLKIVPVKSATYESSSLQAVLPKVFERTRDQTLQARIERIKTTRVKMEYPDLKHKKKRNNLNAQDEDDNNEEKSRFSTSTSMVPIRNRSKKRFTVDTSAPLNPQQTQTEPIDIPLERYQTQMSTKYTKKMTGKSEGLKASTLGEGGDIAAASKKGQVLLKKGTSRNVGLNQMGFKVTALDEMPKDFESIRAKCYEPVNPETDEITSSAVDPNEVLDNYLKARVSNPAF